MNFDFKFKETGLKRTLVKSHLTVAIMGTLVLLLSMATSAWLSNSSLRLANESTPIALSALQTNSGLLTTLASLRGWMTLGEEQFKTQRKEALNNVIWPALSKLEGFMMLRDDDLALAELKELESLFRDLEDWQWSIEDVVRTPGNEPAKAELFRNIDPIVNNIFSAITSVMEIEQSHESNMARKVLYQQFADFRSSFTRSQLSLSRFVEEGQSDQQELFELHLNKSEKALSASLSSLSTLSSPQHKLLIWLNEEFDSYRHFSKLAMQIRMSQDWNVAQFWLSQKALPIVLNIQKRVDQLIQKQTVSMKVDTDNVTYISTFIPWILLALLIAMLSSTLFIALRNAKNIMVPVLSLTEASKKLAAGNLEEDLVLHRSDELGVLASSFNQMRDSLNQSSFALVENQKKITSIFNAASTAMATIDGKGIIQSINHATSNLFSYTEQELLGQKINILTTSPFETEQDRYSDDEKQSMMSRFVGVERELNGVNKNGKKFPILLAVSEVVLSEGKIYIVSIQDLTEAKTVQQKELAAKQELESERAKLIEQDWIKTAFSNITGKLQGLKNLQNLGDTLLSELCASIEAKLGVFYVRTDHEGESIFKLFSSYAYSERKSVSNEFRPGQGLVGQCGLEQKKIQLTDVPKDYHRIQSGLGQIEPKNIIVLPVVHNKEALAIIEIGTLKDFTPIQLNLLDQVSKNIGVFVDNISSRLLTEDLLKQAKILAASEKAQSEELMSANELLEIKSKELEQQTV
ncbi:MAG: PAS domain S-box protein, partial [Deltaproteobacteria bacterium]|nr:PAS domain S-box protein [Deltaproteobacteria bacterium]